MNPATIDNTGARGEIGSDVVALYEQLLTCWNQSDAKGYASHFTSDANMIGFDGSQVDGSAEIERHLSGIFADHTVARYVWKVREVRLLAPDVALLRAVVGMVPPGKSDINPATNAVQSLVAHREDEGWKIALFQNTPAQYHGRPEVAAALTEELRALV